MAIVKMSKFNLIAFESQKSKLLKNLQKFREVSFIDIDLEENMNTDEEKIVKKVYDNLRQNGLFCIEVRTTKDPLCGVGRNMGDDTFFTDHNRRFINSDVFLKHVLKLGFKLRYFTEKNNLSIYKNDNPVLMRIILEK